MMPHTIPTHIPCTVAGNPGKASVYRHKHLLHIHIETVWPNTCVQLSCKISRKLALFLADRTPEGVLLPTCLTTSRAPLAEAVRTFPSSYIDTQTMECSTLSTPALHNRQHTETQSDRHIKMDKVHNAETQKGQRDEYVCIPPYFKCVRCTTLHKHLSPVTWAYRIIRIGPSFRSHHFLLKSTQKDKVAHVWPTKA